MAEVYRVFQMVATGERSQSNLIKSHANCEISYQVLQINLLRILIIGGFLTQLHQNYT
jgi:hypothetical protein